MSFLISLWKSSSSVLKWMVLPKWQSFIFLWFLTRIAIPVSTRIIFSVNGFKNSSPQGDKCFASFSETQSECNMCLLLSVAGSYPPLSLSQGVCRRSWTTAFKRFCCDNEQGLAFELTQDLISNRPSSAWGVPEVWVKMNRYRVLCLIWF